jgi:hypothetical protein
LFVAFTLIFLFITIAAAYRDSIKKTAVLLYDLDPDMLQAFTDLHSAFSAASSSRLIWHITSKANVLDRKYHAGASSVIETEKIVLGTSPPPKIKTNIHPVTVPLGSKTLYFFPDRLLLFDTSGYGAINYQHLQIDLEVAPFITGETSIPSDAQVVDYTWRYVNKSGGPDRRFSNNSQIPVIATSRLHISASSGFQGVIMFSNPRAPAPFVDELRRLASILPASPTHKPVFISPTNTTLPNPRFYCFIQNQVNGPYTRSEVEGMVAKRIVNSATLVCYEGQQKWHPWGAVST